MATLLFDLSTPDEELDRSNVFDIDVLARRLVHVAQWLRQQPETANLPIGHFGASTGAAAALQAAANPVAAIIAVVSRGGRPDLAGSHPADVTASTLLLVGARDTVVVDLNRRAQAALRYENQLVVVPGATNLFEEPGTLQIAAEAARDWFVDHLVPAAPKVVRSAKRALVSGDARQLLGAAASDRLGAAVALLFVQGWRVSEVLGLAWEDLDLDAGIAVVRRAAQAVRRLSIGEHWPTHTYEGQRVSLVFTNIDGGLVNRQAVAKAVTKAAGLQMHESDVR